LDYNWPGNVRELKGVLEYAFGIAEASSITPRHLAPKLARARPGTRIIAAQPPASPQGSGPSEREALSRSGGDQTQAAALLGVNRVTVYNRMHKHGIELKRVLEAH